MESQRISRSEQLVAYQKLVKQGLVKDTPLNWHNFKRGRELVKQCKGVKQSTQKHN